jgi:Peptidogalycan biosysnthesis/recognition
VIKDNQRDMPGSNQDEPLAVLSRAELEECRRWSYAFASERKDHRYYEIVEDTIQREFDYRYFAIKGRGGEVGAVQPFFILDQDLLVGTSPKIAPIIDAVRRLWPGFMRVRTLMIGCAAGEGHLDGDDSLSQSSYAKILALAVREHAQKLKVSIIVLKEFPAKYRTSLNCFEKCGFTRVPSLPMTKLNIDYRNFDDYMSSALNSSTRSKLRKKFKIAAQSSPIEMIAVDDIAPFVSEIYPLYLQVYERSKLHFEKLTEEYFRRIGSQMGDKARFFCLAPEYENNRVCSVHGRWRSAVC